MVLLNYGAACASKLIERAVQIGIKDMVALTQLH